MKIRFNILMTLMLTGCVSSSDDPLGVITEYDRNSRGSSIASLVGFKGKDYYLEALRTNARFDGGNCKPLAINTPLYSSSCTESAISRRKAACYAAALGEEACSSAVASKAQAEAGYVAGSILAETSCSALVSSVRGGEFSNDDAINSIVIGAMDGLADKGLASDSFLGKSAGVGLKIFAGAAKISAPLQCVNSVQNSCTSTEYVRDAEFYECEKLVEKLESI